MNEQLVLLGKITKTHGYSGGLVFIFNVIKIEFLVDFEWIFIESHGEKVPYKIKDRREVDDTKMVISLEDIDDEKNAKMFVNKEFFLPHSQINIEIKDEILLAGLNGWKIYHGDIFIGSIIDTIDNKSQTLLNVKGGGKEFLIPFVEEFVVKISSDEKILLLDLPEGLIDL